MVSLDPNIKNNPFSEVRQISFGGAQYTPKSVEEKSPEEVVSSYGTGQGPNGTSSNGVLGSVEGTGENGKHRLNMYM